MRYSIDCVPCLLGQAVRMVKIFIPEEEEQLKIIKGLMVEMLDLGDDISAPYIAHRMQEALAQALGDPDPYRVEKDYYNHEMIKIVPDLISLRDGSSDPFATALKLAAAGNIIDFGPGYDLSREKVLATIEATMEVSLPEAELAALHKDLEQAGTLLYLGDNTGEIVFDRIFIAAIKKDFPDLKIYFATRGRPVLNDITEADAYLVKMDEIAEIINNGTSIPGTVLEHVSPAFKEIFDRADVIISKGQGNFESLYGSGRDNLYYLFLCKCDLFIERLGANPNDLVFMREDQKAAI